MPQAQKFPRLTYIPSATCNDSHGAVWLVTLLHKKHMTNCAGARSWGHHGDQDNWSPAFFPLYLGQISDKQVNKKGCRQV